MCTRGPVSLGRSPGLTHRQPEPLCCQSLRRGLQPSREQFICGLCTHPAGAVDETLERDLAVSCTWGTCLFLSRMGGNSFLPSTPATRVHTSHIGILVNGVKTVLHLQMGSNNREKAPQWTLSTSYPLSHVSV